MTINPTEQMIFINTEFFNQIRYINSSEDIAGTLNNLTDARQDGLTPLMLGVDEETGALMILMTFDVQVSSETNMLTTLMLGINEETDDL